MNQTLFALALVGASTALAQDTQGFAEIRASLFPGAAGEKLQLTQRLRPTFETALSERVKLVTTIEAALSEGRDQSGQLEQTLRQSELGPLLDAAGCSWPAPRNATFRVGGADDYLDVDRLFLDAYIGQVDVRIGRQAINWGSAQFFNPTDPFPEVLFAEPWRPRRGVNAVRVSVPFGEKRDLMAVAAVNDALDEFRGAARLRLNFAGTDVALVGAWRGRDRRLAGVDLRGTLLVGWWVEGAWLFGPNPHEEIAAGIDYSFPILERTTAFAQYYRNGAGSAHPAALSGAFSRTVGPTCASGATLLGTGEPDPFAPFVSGRDYLLVGSTLVIVPELSASLAALQNLNDRSGVMVPTVNYNLLDWLDLAVSAQVPYALDTDGGELKPRAEDLTLRMPGPSGPATADLSGLLPDATLTFWARASF